MNDYSPATYDGKFGFIQLTQGFWACVDADDYERLNAVKWQAQRGNAGAVYAVRNLRAQTHGGKRIAFMHRLVMAPGEHQVVDHINHNTLDNRKANLRVCSIGENILNRRKRIDRVTSAFKGVSLSKGGRWRADLMLNLKQKYLGLFDDEEAAARTYDRAAVETFGEFACTNEKLGLYGSAKE